jgi:hypothetical protein
MAPGQRRNSWQRAVILSAVGAAIMSTAGLVVIRRGPGALRPQPGLPNDPRPIAGGYFEASGVAHVPGTRQLLFVDDDRPRELFVLEVDSGGRQRTSAVALSLGAHVTDLEGITHDGHYFYVVGSQSKATGLDGDGLVRFTYDPQTRRTHDVESVRDLKRWLAVHVPELRGTETRLGDHVLNVEGLAWDPVRRRLLLGLRAPIVDGKTLIVAVRMIDPGGPFSGENLQLDGAPIRLGLHGAGIRSIEFDEVTNTFVLITGAALNEEGLDFQVLEWKGEQDSMPTLVTTYSRTLKPEGVARARFGGASVRLIIFDTGRLTLLD